MENYQKLDVWQIGLKMVTEVHTLATKLPKEELYTSASQIKRSSTSILANIAEANGRYTYKDRANKYVIARGECYETSAFIQIFIALNFLTEKECSEALALLQRMRMMLSKLIQYNKDKN